MYSTPPPEDEEWLCRPGPELAGGCCTAPPRVGDQFTADRATDEVQRLDRPWPHHSRAAADQPRPGAIIVGAGRWMEGRRRPGLLLLPVSRARRSLAMFVGYGALGVVGQTRRRLAGVRRAANIRNGCRDPAVGDRGPARPAGLVAAAWTKLVRFVMLLDG